MGICMLINFRNRIRGETSGDYERVLCACLGE